MLHKNPFIIAPATFQLVQQLQAIPELKDFYLVGGTALALQLGHRNSIDIDLFTKNEFEPSDIETLLNSNYIFLNVLNDDELFLELFNKRMLEILSTIETNNLIKDYDSNTKFQTDIFFFLSAD